MARQQPIGTGRPRVQGAAGAADGRPAPAPPAPPRKRRRLWLLLVPMAIGAMTGITLGLTPDLPDRLQPLGNAIRERLRQIPLAGPVFFAGDPGDGPAPVDTEALLQRLTELEAQLAEQERSIERRREEMERATAAVQQRDLALREKEQDLAARTAAAEEQLAAAGAALAAAARPAAEQWMAEIYRAMKPAQAVATFDTMEDGMVLAILEQLPTEQVAKILAGMDPSRAARLMEKARDPQLGAGGAADGWDDWPEGDDWQDGETMP